MSIIKENTFYRNTGTFFLAFEDLSLIEQADELTMDGTILASLWSEDGVDLGWSAAELADFRPRIVNPEELIFVIKANWIAGPDGNVQFGYCHCLFSEFSGWILYIEDMDCLQEIEQ